ncbi:MAG: ATP-dependent sacrificial sulfur transferase LarE [Eubacteriales bacterium]|nr:ATP-dependent sacrificial sulfur transferase LarE [Eubacteriales bacterium]
MTLEEFFERNPRCALGFSGGVDSAYLLWAAVRAGAQVRPYFVKTPFQPAFELADARRLAGTLGVDLSVVEMNVLAVEKVAENPGKRCYYCKRAIFGAIRDRALADGYTLLLDGTNASDDASDRPGMAALKELKVRSPLREAGLTKEIIRERSREAGLFTWDKPAYACLATRVPTGRTITGADLRRIEAGEAALRDLGFRDFRLRLYGDAARLQVTGTQLALAVESRASIRRELAPWFDTVLLDLKER